MRVGDGAYVRDPPDEGEVWLVLDGLYRGLGAGIWLLASVTVEGVGNVRLKAGDTVATMGRPRSHPTTSVLRIPVLIKGRLAWMNVDQWRRMNMQHLSASYI